MLAALVLFASALLGISVGQTQFYEAADAGSSPPDQAASPVIVIAAP